ncbi:MAG: NAD(P)/FAD-dependent oxidoreductase [Candidatus Nitrosocosmicus sp.]|nr:NAD(P)/FAD-dependent oxidoreductase [Candidatus Nitrosocosmicus sp.]MDN5866261.1 NAD(P)/FAD-dependent oxidoreductase [Candidatus Nitrosocosmicus sp.]
MKYDIAIVGGGPSGLSAACSASKHGANVVLFEKDPSFGHNVRTSGVTWIKEIEKFDITREYYNPIKNFSFVSPTDQIMISGTFYSACVLDVRKTYQYLASRAASEGSTLLVKSQVIDVKKNPQGHSSFLKVNSPNGPMDVEATLVIDASGFTSFVSRKLGYVGSWKRYGIGAEYECYCDSVDNETLCLMVGQIYSEAGYAWVFPLSKNRLRIGVGIGKPNSNTDPLSKLNQIMKGRLPPLDRLGKIQPLELHYGMIPNDGLRLNSVFDGLIMVGDTVGQANPLVLEGIRYAIEFGRLAGRIGAESLPHNSSRDSLRPYEVANKNLLEKKIKSALKVQSRWLGLSDSEWDKEIEIIKELSMDEFLDFIKSDFTYTKMAKLALNHPRFLVKQLFNLVLNK